MLSTLKTYLRYTSWPIIAAMVALVAVGITAIHVSEQSDSTIQGFTNRQMVFAAVALGVFVFMTIVPYQRVGRLSYVLFGLTLVVLAAVFFLPRSIAPEIRGSRRWIDLGVMMVQLSEIAKFAFIVMLAWYLRQGDNYRRLRGLIVPFVLTLAPMALVLLEPDLGTSLLLLPTLYMLLFVAGAKLRHLLVILALGLLAVLCPAPRPVDADAFAAQRESFVESSLGPVTFYWVDESLDWSRRPELPVAYCRCRIGSGPLYDIQPLSLRIMQPHQVRRIKAWLRPDDPRIARNEGYQPEKGKMILGSGRWTGRGDWNNTESYFTMLPDDHTDFIFSVIGGQWGFLGCLAVLGLYGVIFLFGVEIATITYDPFGRLLAVGVMALLLSQLVINAGMTMGLMPVTGMTLPLVSYGGSSLVINCAALGLLVNVGQRRPILLSRRPFEYGQKRERQPAIAQTQGLGKLTDNGRNTQAT